MAPLQLRIMGGFAAVLATGQPVEVSGKKNRALLTYLALHTDKKITLFPKMTAAFQQLMTGLVDAFYSSTIQAVYYNEQNPNSVKLASPQTSGLSIRAICCLPFLSPATLSGVPPVLELRKFRRVAQRGGDGNPRVRALPLYNG
jgi:hypothetical protein